MKKIIIPIASILLAITSSTSIYAQDNSRAQSIFDLLLQHHPDKGTIRIYQSPEIKALVGRRPSTMMGDSVTKVRGYRVQIFSGNRSKSKLIAQNRENKIKTKHPEILTYVTYEAPFWKLRVGNYLSSDEAQLALYSLKKEFPEYAREMYIVRDAVLLNKPSLFQPNTNHDE